MRRCGSAVVVCCLMAVACGCTSGKQSSAPAADAVRAEDLVGKWRLVRAGGQPPAELWIKSQEIDIAPDGTWASKIEFQLPGLGQPDTFTGKGTWALADGGINYQYGPA